jgi:hypothetical protein
VFDEGPFTVIRFARDTDKPSIAVNPEGTRSYIAFVVTDGVSRAVFVQAVDHGSSTLPTLVAIPTNGAAQNPIVRVDPLSPNRVFVAFQEALDEDQRTWAIKMAMSFDSGGSFFTRDVNEVGEIVEPDAPGAFGDRVLRNGIVMDYFLAVFGDLALHHVVYESLGVTHYRFSLDGTAWSSPVTFSDGSQFAPMQFQPTVRAAEGGDVVVAYYEQPRAGGLTFVSSRRAASPLGPFEPNVVLSRSADGAVLVFEPCARVGTRGDYFGDYMGLLATGGDGFYAAWADSRAGCIETSTVNAVHHHVVGTSF